MDRKNMLASNFNNFFKFILFLLISFLFCVYNGNSQKIRHATRFRNFTVFSETGTAKLVNFSIFQHNMEHRLAYVINVTEDLDIKGAEVQIQRCTFENFACEYFQTWKFPGNLNAVIYMKNQIWTPLFSSIKPKISFPNIKKNIYTMHNATLDAEKAVVFYGDALKYFYRAIITTINEEKRRVLTLWHEVTFFQYVDKGKRAG